MINKLQLTSFVFFNLVIVSVLAQNLLSCDTTSSLDYVCGGNKSQQKCKTFAVLRANPRYSSLSNLSSYLGISRSELAEANGFSGGTDILSAEQPILIPIDCECSSGGIFGAQVRKTTVAGESFYEISESLEGLTTCKAIRRKTRVFPPGILEKELVFREGDKLSELAVKFNVSQETIVSANSRYSRAGLFKPGNSLLPLSTLLIPLQAKPVLGFSAKSQEPNLGYPAASIKVRGSHKRRKPKMWMIGVYIAIGIVGLLACLAIGAAFFFIHCKRKKEDPIKNGDSELQQLSLSIRTTSDKKVSFEGSQYNFDDPITATTTPHKMRDENYTFEELQKATEDFSLSNLIEGSVFHGRLKGKNLAIKRVPSDVISKIDYEIIQERIHRHPNTIRLLGTCLTDSPDSYIVLEYAKNGSLKDWIHGGLAIKSHFIASCNCFLTWNQRVKICVDVATALQYMHHIMNPSYVHRNIKSRNIFLDEDFSAKVGNFGMANCSGQEAEDQESYQTAWNKGYLAPEYLSEGIISPSMDVFAYGVVLLEVLSGKPPITRDEDKEDGSLIKLSDEIKHILQSEDAEELREWIDGALGENYSFDGAVMLANLARSCVEDDPCSRPNAGEIVEKLLRLVEELGEGEELNVCESSCKPLVKAAAIEM
ncbi:UNVERIFIED_CONTAM: protein LYK2 [Sesamum latifolium]|uniref:Protein LYK2 n=1 Tax=Sesamum latifolium TaxID=2727402 RepID=A0AAW2Y7S5_9LAMI